MTATYDLISSTILGSNVTTLTVSSISTSYRDLVIVGDYVMSQNTNLYLRLNGDTANNYNSNSFYNRTSYWPGAVQSNFFLSLAGDPTSQPMFVANIIGANATDKHKNLIIRNDDGFVTTEMHYGRYASTSQITSFTIYPAAGTINAGSTFYVYGLVS